MICSSNGKIRKLGDCALDNIKQIDEIDLIQIVETVWGGKWKIITLVLAFVLSVMGLQALLSAQSFFSNNMN